MPTLNVLETQTDSLVRRLRQWIGDTVSVSFPSDDALTQRLYDTFEQPFLTTTQISAELVDITTEDPLLTNPALTTAEGEIWVLLTARRVLLGELPEAARIAAQLRSPAGSQDTREVYKAIREALAHVESEISELLGADQALLVFVDLTTMNGRVSQL